MTLLQEEKRTAGDVVLATVIDRSAVSFSSSAQKHIIHTFFRNMQVNELLAENCIDLHINEDQLYPQLIYMHILIPGYVTF